MAKKKKGVQIIILTICLLIILIIIAVPLVKKVKKQLAVNSEIQELEEEIAILEGQKSELSGVIDYLQTDQYVKDRAKQDLNYKEPGEQVVVIKKEDTNENADDKNADDKLADISGRNNIVKWWYYFFK